MKKIPSGTTALYHLILARELLSIPPDVEGDVIECGVWKGASTASLSLVCHLTGRRLVVCDSFAGLPETGLYPYRSPHIQIYGYLKEGMFTGSLEEVRTNIQKFGSLEVCDFLPGYFAESLKDLTRPIVFAFLDVDLPNSFHDCLQAIWPLLVENGMIYVDDVGVMDIVRVFFDESWWQKNAGCPAPGLVGSGCGLPLHPLFSNLGYTRKWASFQPEHWQRNPYLFYPEESK